MCASETPRDSRSSPDAASESTPEEGHLPPSPAPTPPPSPAPLRRLWDLAVDLVAAIVAPVVILIILLLRRDIFQVFRAERESMMPTLLPGDRVLVDKTVVAGGRAPERGDVVVFRDGWHEDHEFSIKRVVGRMGDEIEIRRHEVLVDGAALGEPYARGPTHGVVAPLKLGPEHVFVMGDNRCASCDSRTHGPLPVGWIVGQVRFRTGPWRRFGPLDAGQGAESEVASGVESAVESVEGGSG